VVEQPPRVRRSEPGHQLRDPPRGQCSGRVLRPAQKRQHVLDVRRLEEAQPAVLHEGDPAPQQLELERGGVAAAAEQHRLAPQQQALLARRQHRVGDARGLRRLVGHRDEPRPAVVGPLAPQRLGEALGRERDHGIARGQQRRRAAVVLLQQHDPCRRRAAFGETQDVLDRGAAEAVDRLRVVADRGDAQAIRPQRMHEVGLQPVDVLPLVDQHVVEAGGDRRPRCRVPHQRPPREQQVVQVERVLAALGRAVGLEQCGQRDVVIGEPRVLPMQQRVERLLRVDLARVDRQAGRGQREPAPALRQAHARPLEAEQVLGVPAVEQREAVRQAQSRRLGTQQRRGDGMERAAPWQARRGHVGRQRALGGQQAADTPGHLRGGAAGECQQQHPLRIRAVPEQPGHARGQRGRLARAGTGDHEQPRGLRVMLDRGALGRVQRNGGLGGSGRCREPGHAATVCPSSRDSAVPSGWPARRDSNPRPAA
jgi:hypothetical protein